MESNNVADDEAVEAYIFHANVGDSKVWKMFYGTVVTFDLYWEDSQTLRRGDKVFSPDISPMLVLKK